MSVDFSDIEEQYAVEVPSALDNVVVVDNVPMVDEKKEAKLLTVIKKIFKAYGTIKDNGIHMPKDQETGLSKGYSLP